MMLGLPRSKTYFPEKPRKPSMTMKTTVMFLFLPKIVECGCYQCQALKKHNPFHEATLTQGQESNIQ
jgi:hypothetical protein